MITASGLREHCAYPITLGRGREVTPDQQEAMDRGTAFHAAIERWSRTGRVGQAEDLELQGWIDAFVAALPRDPRATLHPEVAWGLDMQGRYVDVLEPEPHVYAAIDRRPLATAGRADLARVAPGGVLAIVDYKTGKWPATPADDNMQLHAAGLALTQWVFAPAYQPAIYYTRDGRFDIGEVVAVDSPEWDAMTARVLAAAALPVDKPLPGPHCGPCWERKKKRCPAAQG